MTVIDLPGWKDLISERTFAETPLVTSLCSKAVCHTLSKSFHIFKAITHEMLLLSTVSLILCRIRVKTPTVDLEEGNVSPMLLLRCSMISLLIIVSTYLLITLRTLIG